jgi:DNA-binding GntR family transcriptional regulator
MITQNLTPINRPVGLADQVYKTLREYLGSHVIRPGQPLQEATLALRLGVSRTPVREALARLLSQGLIAVEGRSFMVPILSDDDVDDIYQMRGILESAALALVALGAPEPAVLAALSEDIEDALAADAANDVEAFGAANEHFHQTWQGQLHNTRLIHAIDLYAGHVRYLRVLTLGSVAARKAALTGMKGILSALRKRDATKAQQVMSLRLDAARKFLRLALDEIERDVRDESTPVVAQSGNQ